MFKILPILLLVAVVYCEKVDNIDSLIEEVFGIETATGTQDKSHAFPVAAGKAPDSGTDIDSLIDGIFGPETATKAQDKPQASPVAPGKAPDSGTDIDSILAEVFGPETATGTQAKPQAPPVAAGKAADNAGDKAAEKICKAPDGREGKCVAYYLCGQPDGTGSSDISVVESDCPSYLDVCCISSVST